MRRVIAQPACAALFQPDVSSGDFAFAERHPAFQTETRRLERHIILHPFAQPRLDVNIVGL
ncbi:Uncharacterised protein [Salmonella enterica subsp. enterica serovar Bovismorbificans]|uniref:Uncharacterized protein n=1 Tax=Salmonella enterica subsp. enterica serovar Bovismorbificans TaxID=58097 RepID=A0A655DSD7_SALET|nr:Uncharacterised protein [Salmonella enterica subsp. enterica serovar Bovismorbificans]